MQLLFSFDRDMRVEKTLMQTLASQLLSTLMQLLFSFNRDMRVEKNMLVQKLFTDSSIVSINETQILIEQKNFLPYRVAKSMTSFESLLKSETERLSLRQNNL